MAELRRLLEPGLIKNVRIKNRVSIGPMERSMANMDGSISQRYLDYLEERAKNGVGMITMESTYIEPAGHRHIYQLGLHSDGMIPSHKQLTETMHKYGTKVAAELYHAGRETSATASGFQPVAPSNVPCLRAGGDILHELTADEIHELAHKFAEAARRAKEAGYDMVTLHGAHGYLINAFASPFSNKRTDDYGGTPEKRMRFPLEVYQAVRAAVGNQYPVGYRISADEFIDGGLTIDDTKIIAKKLEDAGIDYLDVSAAIYDSMLPITGTMDFPIGYLMHLAASLKEAVKIPVIAVGRINDMVFAESILENNQADFVHMVRAFHADPEILLKSQKGQSEDINMCMACNKCIDALSADSPVICTVNPAAGREREFRFTPAKKKKKVMVVGGGVAGMEAARIARMRGHEVTLFEKDGELGGQVRWASKGKYHEEFFQAARFRIHEMKRLGVIVKLGQEISPAEIGAFRPEAIVIATGALPFVPAIPGINNALVATSFDILSGKRKFGKKAVVIGGKREGLTVAEFLVENGSRVTIVENRDILGADFLGSRHHVITGRIQENPLIEVKLKTTVERIEDDGLTLQSAGKMAEITGYDTIVVAWARAPVNSLADRVLADGKIAEVYHIGDALRPRDAADAIYEGAVTGMRI